MTAASIHCGRCGAQVPSRDVPCLSCGTRPADWISGEMGTVAKALRSRQLLVVGAILSCGVVGAIALAGGFAMGRLAARASAHPPVALVESNQVEQARIAHALRALPVGTRFTLHDANLRELFSDSVFHVVETRFTRITLSAEPPPATGTDVTLVTNDDTAWRQRLSRSEQQIMLAALTRVHQHFLALAGQGDTVAFAAMLVARDPAGHEHVLALRDRYGRLLTD